MNLFDGHWNVVIEVLVIVTAISIIALLLFTVRQILRGELIPKRLYDADLLRRMEIVKGVQQEIKRMNDGYEEIGRNLIINQRMIEHIVRGKQEPMPQQTQEKAVSKYD